MFVCQVSVNWKFIKENGLLKVKMLHLLMQIDSRSLTVLAMCIELTIIYSQIFPDFKYSCVSDDKGSLAAIDSKIRSGTQKF